METICPIEFTLSLIDGKWKIVLLKELSHGALRYGEITRRLRGISSKVLIQHLRGMEEDGLVLREVFPEVPPRVEYSLTSMGVSVASLFGDIRRWGLESGAEKNVACKMCAKCQNVHGGARK